MSKRDPTGESMASRGNATLGLALLLATGVLWGTIGVASKGITLESSFDAVSISWLRAVIASPVCLFAGWMVLGKRLFAITRRDFGVMVMLGVALVVYQWLYLAAIDRLGVSAATLISLCGAPVIVAVVSILALREPMTGFVVLSLIGALAGTVLLVGSPETGYGRETAVGVLLAVGSAIGIASHVMGCRSIARRTHPVQPLAIGFPVGAIAFAPVALLRGVSFNQPAEAWLLLLYLGIVPSSIAYFLYQRGLQDVPATMASIVTMIEPLIAGLLAWYFFDERLGIWGLVGGALLLGSIGLLTMQSRRLVPSAAPAPEGAVTP